MSENIPYDFGAIQKLANMKYFIFVGEEEARDVATRFAKGIKEQTLDVILFPYLDERTSGGAVPNAGLNPKRATFTGTLLSTVMNERANKGEFRFSDGTVIHLDTNILV